ncbi:MAG: hypothetical protein ABFS28_16080 [Bacteroidota bacterium]
MTRRRSYSYIYNVQRIILLVFYTTTAIALSVPLAKLVTILFPNNFFPLIITLILYLVAVVIVGSLIHVISYIPFNLAASFDPVKNEIASGEIKTIDQLGKRISAFTVDFFDFSFLDITHAFIQTAASGLISHEEIPELEKVLEEYRMLEKSQELEEVIRAGEITLPEGRLHLYILPIWFGDHWLGYMALLSEKRISRFFLRFLSEYENNFLDDQIMHIVHYSKRG